VRQLSQGERMVWGRCQECGAKHGDICTGTAVTGSPGVHVDRLSRAPYAVREIDAAEYDAIMRPLA